MLCGLEQHLLWLSVHGNSKNTMTAFCTRCHPFSFFSIFSTSSTLFFPPSLFHGEDHFNFGWSSAWQVRVASFTVLMKNHGKISCFAVYQQKSKFARK